MSVLTRLPDLLHRIDVLDSGTTLCRQPGCYAETYRWLSPYCEPACAPRVGLQGPSPNPAAFDAELERTRVRNQIAQAFGVPPALLESSFDRDVHAMRVAWLAGERLAAQAVSPSALLRGLNVC